MSSSNGYHEAVATLRDLFAKGRWDAFNQYVVSLRGEGWGEDTISCMVGNATRGIRPPRRAA